MWNKLLERRSRPMIPIHNNASDYYCTSPTAYTAAPTTSIRTRLSLRNNRRHRRHKKNNNKDGDSATASTASHTTHTSASTSTSTNSRYAEIIYPYNNESDGQERIDSSTGVEVSSSTQDISEVTTLIEGKDNVDDYGDGDGDGDDITELSALIQTSDEDDDDNEDVDTEYYKKVRQQAAEYPTKLFRLQNNQDDQRDDSDTSTSNPNMIPPPHRTNTTNVIRTIRKDQAMEPIMITGTFTDVRSKYQITNKILGRGHYGIVRACINRTTHAIQAMKSINKSIPKDPKILSRELTILQSLNHPHIIKLHDIHEDSSYLHLITDLCSGGDLFSHIIQKRDDMTTIHCYTEQQAATIIYQLIDAISYCHSRDIVHRDLKPENIVFANTNDISSVKIIDFGLSRYTNRIGVMTTKVGTPNYVAPEVLNGAYTKKCDIWSIGVITYILLCGYAPFGGDTDNEVLKSVRSGRFHFPKPEWTMISNDAKQFVAALLEYNQFTRLSALEAIKHKWLRQQMKHTSSGLGGGGGASFSISKALLFLKQMRSGICCMPERVKMGVF